MNNTGTLVQYSLNKKLNKQLSDAPVLLGKMGDAYSLRTFFCKSVEHLRNVVCKNLTAISA